MFEVTDDNNNNQWGKVIIVELLEVVKYFSKDVITPKPLIGIPFLMIELTGIF